MQGKLKVNGDMSVAMKLGPMLPARARLIAWTGAPLLDIARRPRPAGQAEHYRGADGRSTSRRILSRPSGPAAEWCSSPGRTEPIEITTRSSAT
jgi:hypothetical protein